MFLLSNVPISNVSFNRKFIFYGDLVPQIDRLASSNMFGFSRTETFKRTVLSFDASL